MPKAVRAKEGFFVGQKSGRPRLIARGALLPATDPAVKSNPAKFEDVDEVVERATAKPGEKRSTKPRSKAKKPDAAE